MDLIAWVKICKERLPTETNLTQFIVSVAYGCSFIVCPLYVLLNITGSCSCNWKLHKDSSQQKGILLMTDFSFKCWTKASRHTKPKSLKQFRDGHWHGPNECVCACAPMCVCVRVHAYCCVCERGGGSMCVSVHLKCASQSLMMTYVTIVSGD